MLKNVKIRLANQSSKLTKKSKNQMKQQKCQLEWKKLTSIPENESNYMFVMKIDLWFGEWLILRLLANFIA